jgi:hypothetical protein
VLLPDTLSYGDWYLIGAMDYSNQVKEIDETNNIRYSKFSVVPKRFRVKDLSFVPPLVLYLEDSIQLSAIATLDESCSGLSSNYYRNTYLSSDSVLDVKDRYLASKFINTFYVQYTNIRIPKDTPQGTYYLIMEGSSVGYFNQYSSYTYKAVKILVRDKSADLQIPKASYQFRTGGKGAYIEMNSIVLNDGKSATQPFSVGYYLSLDTLWSTDDEWIGLSCLDGFDVNKADTIIEPLFLSSDVQIDKKYVIVAADIGMSVKEIIENNNTNFIRINGEVVTEVSVDQDTKFVNGGGWHVYPNPNHGKFYVSKPNNIENVRIEIYDLNNRMVYSDGVVSDMIDLGDRLNQGLYLIKLGNEEQQLFGRLVIE